MKNYLLLILLFSVHLLYGQTHVAPKPSYVILINNELASMEKLEAYAKQGYVKSMNKGVSEEKHAELVKQFGNQIGDKEFIILISLFTEEEKEARTTGNNDAPVINNKDENKDAFESDVKDNAKDITVSTNDGKTVKLSDLSKEALVLNVNDAAKDFTVNMIDGKTMRLSELRGKIVLLNFWATWCAPCLLEFHDFPSKIIEPNKSNDFVLLPISRGETKQKVSNKMLDLKKRGIDFNVGVDPDETIWNQYAKSGIPLNFLIDKNGIIRYVSMGNGEANIETLAKEIQKLLKE
ncbi:TlpA family protein disulfide reductase [Pontibacter sp. MBLB2868]|uniref:TlpA family protein disulfide reductase n=1 Tax=Pontibacter sp. MBLB2868 TaxID=3451555 RepID=UPI003F74C013